MTPKRARRVSPLRVPSRRIQSAAEMPTVSDAGREESLARAFMRLPRASRVVLILSTYLLAASIAIIGHVLYANASAMKPSVYVAGDGRGDRELVQRLSIPKSSE